MSTQTTLLFSDPVLNALHEQVVMRFGALELIESIMSQQLAVKAAATITQRVHALIGADFSPTGFALVSDEELRSAGLSGQKTRYVRAISEAWRSGQIVPEDLTNLSDEAVIAALTALLGVGRWTAEMFLLFGMGRLDIFSAGDYGLRKAATRAYALPENAGPAFFTELAAQWSPHRSLASRILWKSLDLEK